MGTDIHGVFQRKDAETQKWADVSSAYEQNRHYQLFAVLAGVRNGIGFAGCRTGEEVEPIAEPRGLPSDFELTDDCHPLARLDLMDPRRRKWAEEGEPISVWMGDHSHSWLTGAEILAWADKSLSVEQCGFITRAEYDTWEPGTRPKNGYCGGIAGPNVVTITDSAEEKRAFPDWTHIRVRWSSNLSDELEYFLDEIRRLTNEHGEIRFVFGFDS